MAYRRGLVVSMLAAAAICASVLWLGTQPFTGAIASSPPSADPARLELHVRKLSEEFYPRSFEQAAKLDAAAAYIEHEFRSAGAQVAEQPVTVQESRYRNIIARFGPPTGPVLVIGAHYDSYGDVMAGASLPRGFGPRTHTPGADDNASGVAALLELARLLAKNPPRRTVELVAYTLEELPHYDTEHMGSVWHARALRRGDTQVALMLSLEMIGFFSDTSGSQSYPLPGMGLAYPDKGEFIAIVGRIGDWRETRRVKAIIAGASDLPVRSMNGPVLVPGVDFSDHRSYWAEGFPALMITDTAFHRNPHYHQAEDTYEKLDYRRMAKVVQAVFAVAQGY